MVDTVAQIVLDISFLGGFVLLAMGLSRRYKKHRLKFIFMGIVLIMLGIFFIDWQGTVEMLQQGSESTGQGIG